MHPQVWIVRKILKIHPDTNILGILMSILQGAPLISWTAQHRIFYKEVFITLHQFQDHVNHNAKALHLQHKNHTLYNYVHDQITVVNGHINQQNKLVTVVGDRSIKRVHPEKYIIDSQKSPRAFPSYTLLFFNGNKAPIQVIRTILQITEHSLLRIYQQNDSLHFHAFLWKF